MDNFAVFILTHGRPNKVTTFNTLKKQGYTGKVYLIVDDEDKTLKEYQKNFGDKVIIFSKDEIAKTFDLGDNFDEKRAIIYARNACFEIAKTLGVKYFLQLDDDYTYFSYKFNGDNQFISDKFIKNLDKVFHKVLGFYKSINALTVAFSQNGDFIGGGNSGGASAIKCKRKAMNSFFCSTNRPFKFVGKVNEDVNTYTTLGHKGFLFLTVNNLSLFQPQTQQNSGGMSELYLDSGTYQKSFYTVMFCPSFVKIFAMGDVVKRLHHKINWEKAVPKILRETVKKI